MYLNLFIVAKSWFIFILPFLFFINILAYPKVIVVSQNGTLTSVKKAVQISQRGDKIIIKQGTYFENNIIIDKSLYIEGEQFPVIDGKEKESIFIIQSDSVSIKGLQIQNIGMSQIDDRAGIKLTKVKNCIIEKNKLINTCFGIYFSKSSDCIIRNNTVIGFSERETETGNAIHLFYCKNFLIENNTLSGHRDGIYFEFVENTKIYGNSSCKQIRYGMHFMFSHDNEYYKNKFSNNGAGVAVMYSHHIYMHENYFSDNWSPISNGLLLKDIKDSKIENNYIDGNTIGIFAEGCLRLNIKYNRFSKNGWALKILGDCYDNKFIENNFMSNTFEIVTNATVSNNIFEHNYWTEYSGYDLNNDGVGDIPHSPVRLYTYIIEKVPESIILLRSLFIDLLNMTEKVAPVITPESLVDNKPSMKEIKW